MNEHKRPKINLRSLGRIVGILTKTFPVQLAVVLLCIVVSALVGVVPAVFTERLSAIILDGLETGWEHALRDLIRLLIPVICAYLLGLASAITQTQIMARVTQGFLHTLRTQMFDKMQELPIRYFDTHNHGDVMSYYTNDVDTLRQLVFQPSVIVSAALEDEDSVLNLQDIVITGSDGEEHRLSVGEFERNIADNAARLSRTLRDGMTELRDRAVLGAEELAEYWKNAFEQARADLRAAWESVEEAVSGVIDAAGQAVQGAMDDVGAALRDAEDDLKGLWNSLWGN